MSWKEKTGRFGALSFDIDKIDIDSAADLLARGEVIAIPTETVYGLAAAIDQPEAVAKVFRLKERPFFDPLIVHISDISQVDNIAREFPEPARKLAEHFWPGPLTIVLPRQPTINPMICAGLDTVGVRAPAHPVARKLLQALGTPLAAPSANKFGKTSATTAAHVRSIWSEQELFVLDGGPCPLGIESTVVELVASGSSWRLDILRPGMVTESDLRDCLRGIEIGRRCSQASPGHVDEHYQPESPLVVIGSDQWPMSEKTIDDMSRNLGISSLSWVRLDLTEDPAIAARLLYSELHRLSAANEDVIIFLRTSANTSKDWDAIWDRLRRAASLVIAE